MLSSPGESFSPRICLLGLGLMLDAECTRSRLQHRGQRAGWGVRDGRGRDSGKRCKQTKRHTEEERHADRQTRTKRNRMFVCVVLRSASDTASTRQAT